MTGGPSIKVVDATTKELTTMMQTLTYLHKEESIVHATAAKEQQESLNSLIRSTPPTPPTPPLSDQFGPSPSTFIPDHQIDSSIKTPKIDFPKFDGENPRSWVRRWERFFQLKSVPSLQKTQFASIHLIGKAESWFHDYQTGKTFISWSDFSSSQCERFENLANENFVGCFNKLTQINSVDEYYEKFEPLKDLMLQHNPHYTEDYFVMSFLSGLKEVIRISVEMHKPTTLSQAYYLDHLQESALASQHQQFPKSTSYKPPTTTTYFSKYSPPTQKSTSPTTHTAPIVPSPPTPTSQLTKSLYVPPPIRRLSREQQDKRRAQCLCYSYSVVVVKEEVALIQPFSLTEDEPETTDQPPPPDASTDSLVESNMEISLHALTGTMSVDTIRIPGLLKHRVVTVLVDTGSTHSFIDSALVNQLSVKFNPQHTWDCDIVLGEDWLCTLGDVTFNLSKLSISFLHNCQLITLQGSTSKPSLMLMSGNTLRKFINKTSPALVCQFFHIDSTPIPEPIPPPPPPPPQVHNLIDEFKDVFSEPTNLPPTRSLDHKIQLKLNTQPITLRPFKCPDIHKSMMESLVQEMLKAGIIQDSQSPFASPILLVKKMDNTWRFCVDYRNLNDITIKDKFPIPIIDELLDELHGATIFTKLDLRSGYHQIRFHEADIHKTAFRTHHGHYEFKCQPSSHLHHLSTALTLLRQHQLFAKFSKCTFSQSSLQYLGHIITAQGVAADPEKIKCMQDWPIPTNLKQLRGFLGLTGYYRKFVRGYGTICKPLTDLLKNNSLHWSTLALDAFNSLKTAMCTTPVLALSDFSKPFVVESDACSHGVGVVLMKDGKAIDFFSNPLGPKNLGLSTYEKELLVVVMEVTRWRHYLLDHHSFINTDQQSIKCFMELKITTVLQQRWLMKLLGSGYTI
ncbi:uncharacterized protein LOC113359896 [Papaver somniferum]|uniref:uncharacterized protein LOC113359896 n=1 Tax=Papaver somniferum TaxID=3469 RepID=UPI000E6F51A9|nr:uncharacterized protein LOC113359896 [Papaver somniferum]